MEYKLSKYVARWREETSGKWFEVDWLDVHLVNKRRIGEVRRSLNRSFKKDGINQHVSRAMGHRVKFGKCLIVNRESRKLVFRSD